MTLPLTRLERCCRITTRNRKDNPLRFLFFRPCQAGLFRMVTNEKFRLYYTAEGEEAHNFIVVVEDNFNNS